MLAIAILPALAFASVAFAAPAPTQLEARYTRVTTVSNGLPGGFVVQDGRCVSRPIVSVPLVALALLTFLPWPPLIQVVNAPTNGDGVLFKGSSKYSGMLSQQDCAQFVRPPFTPRGLRTTC
jgi:hypothetical protein